MDRNEAGSWKGELDDFTRAFSGAFLFGITLLFTMEMWWIGTYLAPWKLFLILALTFGASFVLNYFAGFKKESSYISTFDQTANAVAVGIVSSLIVLVVLNRISLNDPLDSILGMIVVQTLPLTVGVSLANIILPSGGESGKGESAQEEESRPGRATLKDLGVTAIGGVFIGFTIAPTQEIPLLAAELGYFHQLALIVLSLVLSYIIVFASGFDPRRGQQKKVPGILQRPAPETLVAYTVALLVSLLALYLFAHVKIGDPIHQVVSQTLVLGLPVAIGGAAGRVAV